MRSLVWWSTAAVLLMVGTLLVASQHAARHPDSFVGRCAMAIYHVWDPQIIVRGEVRPSQQVALAVMRTDPSGPTAPAAEPIEPIVVVPTDQEPPLAVPRLSPEVAAAIERLRSEEESETPPVPFDIPRALRMPEADEEVEVLPEPTPDAPATETEAELPGTYGFFVLPSSCWQTVCDKVMDSIRQLSAARPGNDEAADEGAMTDDTSAARNLQEEIVPYHHYHDHGCPYSGGCPYPYYRNMPAPARK